MLRLVAPYEAHEWKLQKKVEKTDSKKELQIFAALLRVRG